MRRGIENFREQFYGFIVFWFIDNFVITVIGK